MLCRDAEDGPGLISTSGDLRKATAKAMWSHVYVIESVGLPQKGSSRTPRELTCRVRIRTRTPLRRPCSSSPRTLRLFCILTPHRQPRITLP